MPMVSLDQIVAGPNVRGIAVPAAVDRDFAESIRAQGVLQPVLLRPEPNGAPVDGASPSSGGSNLLQIVLGSRRIAAARAAGLIEVPAEIRAMTDGEVAAAQMAENMQRAAMHPVDQWRGMRSLIQDHGLTFTHAASALGMDERATRQMEMLGRLNPTLLALCQIQMPSLRELRIIAAAPQKLQAAVAKEKGLVRSWDDEETVQWYTVVQKCQVRRIPRAFAIFDVDDPDPKKVRCMWDEDLFAEPGSDEQFTTADVDIFRARQTEAMNARVAGLVAGKKERKHQVALIDRGGFSIDFPAGFKATFDGKPEKPRKHEVAFYAIAADGQIIVRTARDTKAMKADEKKKADRANPELAGTDSEPADDDEDSVEPVAKPPFTKAGLALIAAAKTEAVRKQLQSMSMDPATVLSLLVLALNADNVEVRGVTRRAFEDLASRILAPGGNVIPLSDADIAQIGQTAIGRILHFDSPDTVGGWQKPTSGAAAEWIGAAIGAGDSLDRFDTPEFLDTANAAELKRAALDALLTPTGTAKALRERLANAAPKYRPETAQFGAPAPRPKATDDDEGEDDDV